MRTFGAVLD